MRRSGNSYILMMLLAVLFFPCTVLAEIKIGFVNSAQVLEQAPQADAARAQLQKEFKPRDEEIVKMQKELKGMEEKMLRDSAVMSESERRKMERDIISLKRDMKRKKDEFREDLNIRQNEVFERLRKRIYEVIVTIAEQKKYDLIVSDVVVFASKRIDITAEVVEKLKQEMKNTKK